MEGANLESLLERVIQMNMIIIEEMQEQQKQMHDQQELISTQLSIQLSTTTTSDALNDPSHRSNRISIDFHRNLY
jgi:hypothetical protein